MDLADRPAGQPTTPTAEGTATGRVVGGPGAGVWLMEGDCLEVLRGMDDGSVDAIITDPPYNVINRATGGLRSFDKGTADSSPIDISTLTTEFVRITRGSIYIWCSDEQYTDWVVGFNRAGLTTRKCAWWKTNPSPMNGQYLWLSALELCVFARKPGSPFYRHCAHPVWRGPVARVKGHPTPKPTWLMCEQVTASVPPRGTVLDPFMGSGSTGVACVEEGRSFIGIEKDPDYFDIATRRIAEAHPGQDADDHADEQAYAHAPHRPPGHGQRAPGPQPKGVRGKADRAGQLSLFDHLPA